MKRKKQKEETKKLLEQVSYELFQKQGYPKTTVSQITEQAGVAKGTFFNYFQSKEDVIHATSERLVDHWTKQVDNLLAAGGPIEQAIYALFSTISDDYEKTGRPLIRSIWHIFIMNDEFHKKEVLHAERLKNQLIRLLEEGKKRGEFSSHFCTEKLGFMMLHHFFGLVIHWCTNYDSPPLYQMVRESLHFFLTGTWPKPAMLNDTTSNGKSSFLPQE